ncbi:sigma-70 family RNA polymerase sigma factor [Candidatus Chloroploca sp. M-50]|uniref:Sigma-70 family RNA polymerase sigma factor n=1 Tax=Candidatus Chloroploca mongolica TaxID=2528176 RepID=A0ABS4DF31_9CHLR|nr:sigma-70 family RNA polymerase sigma factor [Candidatus Chloroploca mongolica]MBP1468064.1 sigma-70 family RNA polymerase sigma factor [Candidatus Chloroploca mongolica]
MNTGSRSDHDILLGSLTLDDLYSRCEAQLAAFQQSRDSRQDSRSCEEILRRAANRDEDAFAWLWRISIPLVRKLCPVQCRGDLDDLQQEVAINLLRKFRHPTSPYQARSFAEYRVYLHTTVFHTCLKMPRISPAIALESLRFEPSQGEETDAVMRHAFYERCLVLLPDELHREAFRRRFVLHEDPATIAAALRDRDASLTIKDAYRLIERCIKLLAKLPEIGDMLEA